MGESFGCARCSGDDAAAAWEAIQAGTRLAALIEESHHSVRLAQCGCGQRFVIVFTERIDWVGGNDPQDWRALPITAAECDQLAAKGEAIDHASIEALGRERRYLVRSFPSDHELSTRWRDGGLWIGPHD